MIYFCVTIFYTTKSFSLNNTTLFILYIQVNLLVIGLICCTLSKNMILQELFHTFVLSSSISETIIIILLFVKSLIKIDNIC